MGVRRYLHKQPYNQYQPLDGLHDQQFPLGLWPVRLMIRTPGFHPGNRSLILLRATNIYDRDEKVENTI